MNGLDLFSGIGGLTIALKNYVTPVAYCENEIFAQAVLLQNMVKNRIPKAPIWNDVQTLKGQMLPPIDIVYGGFPCQDISAAGRGVGLEGKRSGLFFQIVRLAEETRAPFIFLENVPAIRTRGLQRVIDAFADLRYDCRWTCISAAEVGAPHLRKRWWLLAHAPGISERKSTNETDALATRGQARYESIDGGFDVADSASGRRHQRGQNSGRCGSRDRTQTSKRSRSTDGSRWWDVEPDVGRVADGVSGRVDRLRGLGNAVVPFQAKTAFERLLLGIE